MALRCAILDDYQNVALTFADWSKVKGDVEIRVFNEHLGSQDKVIAALQGFAIVCAMRERTAFPRAVIEALPDLKLLITTGMRNASIDLEAAKARGVVVCGTPAFGNATSCPRRRPDARADTPHRLRERPAQSRRPLADDHRARPRRHDACASRPRQARRPRRRDQQGVGDEPHRLEPEPDAGALQRGRRRVGEPHRRAPAAWSARANSA